MADQVFLQKATKLFLKNGAKTLTMDDVAKEFGISKKTLYQMYRNKEELIEDVLAYKLQDIIKRMKELDQEFDNAVERMFCKDTEVESAINSNNSVFIRQLRKYYPAIFNKHMVNFSSKFSDVLIGNIEKGRKQGYYRDGFNAELYAKFIFQIMLSYDSTPFFAEEEVDYEEFHDEALMMYMHAITTEKGKEILKKINS
ncbi:MULTISPECIES: TetR/AcrR family transcriptional regulator [Chryseobacterium]|uniref:TetR/AcrR family transcriptional regulator n=1 Tax=Chryseobacterium sp. R2A-55 TaxID=2744445 RepID=UPI001F380E8C|nr:TetR/AcrR family transcriptional regulator [Chryseobacterium sp. R2A-55]